MAGEDQQHNEDTVHITWLGDSPTPSPPPPRGRSKVGITLAVLAAVGLLTFVSTRLIPHPATTTTTAPVSANVTSMALPSAQTSHADTSSTPDAPPPPDFSAIAQQSRVSIVRVVASTCRGTGVSTGFWLDDGTIITSYYAVAQAVSVAAVDEAGDPLPVTIAGTSPSTGVAVLRATTRSAGGLQLGDDAEPGDWLSALELPDKTLALKSSRPAPLERTGGSLEHRGTTHTGLAQLPGTADISAAGSPVIDSVGQVRGMLLTVPDQRQRLFVPASQISAAIQSLTPDDEAFCERPTGPHSMTVVTGDAPEPAKRVLRDYFGGINSADYQLAFDALGPKYHQSGSTLAGISKGWVSTYDFNIRIRESSGSTRAPHAWVTFDSIFQDGRGPEGLTCARWSIDYTLERRGGALKISGNKAHNGDDSWHSEC